MSYNFSQQITVFVITSGKSINYNDCITSLKNQTIDFKLKIIKDIHPMSKAFQKMIDECNTPYYIEVDDDMILDKHAIVKLFQYITYAQAKVNKKTAISLCQLYDPHLDMNICGVKIYDHRILRKYPYNLNSISCEVDQIKAMEKDGYVVEFQRVIVGKHAPKWTNEGIFERYYNLLKKFEKHQYIWIEKLPKKLWDKLKSNPTDQNLYALLGAYTAFSTDKKLAGEKDFRNHKMEEVGRIEAFLNSPRRATLYMSSKCNFNCEWCMRQHQKLEQAEDMNVAILSQIFNKFPEINSFCLCGFGETLMCKNLKEIIHTLKARKKFVGLITNGSLITEKLPLLGKDLPNYISISLNAPNVEVHERITRTKTFNEVIKGIELCTIKGIPTYLSYVCTKKNLSHIPEFLRLAKSLKVKGVHLHNLLPHFDEKLNGNDFWDLALQAKDEHLFDEIKKLSEASIVEKYPILIEKGETRRYCNFPWNHIGVNGNGGISICNSVYPADTKNGNINDFVIWHDKYCCEFRDKLLGKQLPACKKCFRNWEKEEV